MLGLNITFEEISYYQYRFTYILMEDENTVLQMEVFMSTKC